MANLGDCVRDPVSGFQGTVLAKMEAVYEATQCRVHPSSLSQAGEMLASVWIEDARLVVTSEKRVTGFLTVAGKR